jgi:hypothetical protein
MQELIEQQDREPLNFGQVWQRASFHNKIEMQKIFYPEGLVWCTQRKGGTLNRLTAVCFYNLNHFSLTNSILASPTGFEPVLPP